MAVTDYYLKYQQQNQANNPSKFSSHFLYKALAVTIFLFLLPLFPSQPPEFINHALKTGGWEFLHLIFVGIAVSYGLFSRRNDAAEKDNNPSKFDNAQSYICRFLQVSSVFDDETEIPTRSDGSTVQTWNSQYYRNDPVVVIADENSVTDQEQRSTTSRIGEIPLLLPVRSLKSLVLEADGNETDTESSSSSGVYPSISRSSSNLGSKRISSNPVKSINGEFGGLRQKDLQETMKENIVLPSTIPWRSKSGRMETKETKVEPDSPPLYSLPPSMEEPEYIRPLRTQVSRSPRTDSTYSSPKKLSPSASFPAEAQSKSAENFVRKKSFKRSPPPPPPPPPTPQMNRKSCSTKPISRALHDEGFCTGKDMKRSYTSESKESNRSDGLSIPRSLMTARSSASLYGIEFDDMIKTKAEKRLKEIEASAMNRVGRKKVAFDQSSFKTERQNRDRVTFMPQPTYREFRKEAKQESVERLVLESEHDMGNEDEDDDDNAGSCFVSGTASASPNNEEAASTTASDAGPDVDKKAEEFIAKFREQIRLQRIESIRRSNGQISRKPSR